MTTQSYPTRRTQLGNATEVLRAIPRFFVFLVAFIAFMLVSIATLFVIGCLLLVASTPAAVVLVISVLIGFVAPSYGATTRRAAKRLSHMLVSTEEQCFGKVMDRALAVLDRITDGLERAIDTI